MSNRRKMNMTYDEWMRNMAREQKRLRNQELAQKHARKHSLEVIRRFFDSPAKLRYNRGAAKLVSRMHNPNLVKRDGVFQQRAKYTLSFRTKYGVVVLTTKTRGIDTQRIRKLRNSSVRETVNIDAFTVDSSHVELPQCPEACAEYEQELQALLANHFARQRTEVTEDRLPHNNDRLEAWQGRRKVFRYARKNSDITG